MDTFSQSVSLEAGINQAVPELRDRDSLGNGDSAGFVFPDPLSTWRGPDTSYHPVSPSLLCLLERFFPLSFRKQHTRHVAFACRDAADCLAREAVHVYSAESPSNDADGMGVLVFGRLHHLNLHAFEEELAGELVALQTTKTTSREQILRVRNLLPNIVSMPLSSPGPLNGS